MLKINSEIQAHLEAGGTLLVPSRQRANAVRLAYTAAMLERGLRVWDTPDVLPWTAWFERELNAARERDTPVPRRLTTIEEWLLWQEAVQHASADSDVLMPDGLIEPVRRAIGRMDDFAIRLQGAPTAESAALIAAMTHFKSRCDELKVVGRASWRALAGFVEPNSRLLLAGFTAIGPAREAWLREHGARVAAQTSKPSSLSTVRCNSPRHEAERAATWCAQWLSRDAGARLLVVVPQLRELRHLWESAFQQRLNPTALLEGRAISAQSNFAIEGGRPLAEYRLVTTALHLLALGAGRGGFVQLSEILRSPYLSVGSMDARCVLERWLREQTTVDASLPALLRVQPVLASKLGDAVAELPQRLVDALRSDVRSVSATPAEWAQSWVEQLRRCGWPGEAPGSDEQQVRMRFDELLGEFAAVIVPARRMMPEEAFGRLQSLARRVAFEPASDDVPVTLTARLEEPIVSYDGIWVAGLSADAWPPPARPDPLLPLPWQRAAGIPEASAEGQARRAQQLLEAWQRSSAECVVSFPHSDEDMQKDRSPLLPAPAADAEAPLCYETSAGRWLEAHAPVLEVWTEQTRPAARSPDRTLAGGTRLLELQSLCPFRAYAELRLEAVPLETPQPGVPARLRGIILHKALERFWSAMSDQSNLQAMPAPQREQIAQSSAAAAIAEVIAREAMPPGERLLQRERARTVRLIGALIDWELARPQFLTQVVEESRRFEIGGIELRLQRDRVDQLTDGQLIIIDYKSGAPKTFDALADRMSQPQLPAYAVASGARACAVVTLYVGRDGVKARGLQDRSGRIPRLPSPKSGELAWPERMERWRQQLEALIEEFLQGDAGLRPQPDACKYCHLHTMCRIDPATIAALDTDPDELEGEDAESDSEEESE